MRKTLIMLTIGTMMLAACGDKKSDRAANGSIGAQSEQEVKEITQNVALKPGKWEGDFSIESLTLSNMPEGTPKGMEEQTKKMMSRKITYCVSPEDAANPNGKLFSGQDSKDCTYSGFEARGGSVKGRVSCNTNGANMTAEMSGNYAPASFEMHMDMKQSGGPNGMEMAMKAKTSGKWIGESCS